MQSVIIQKNLLLQVILTQMTTYISALQMCRLRFLILFKLLTGGREVHLVLTLVIEEPVTINLSLTQIIDDETVFFGGTISGDYTKPGNVLVMLTSAGETTFELQKDEITVDGEIIQNGINPVTGGAIYTALLNKDDVAFVVTIQEDNGNFLSDKTISEIIEAAESGNDIYAVVDVGVKSKLPLVAYSLITSTVLFGAVSNDEGVPQPVNIIGTSIAGNDEWVFAEPTTSPLFLNYTNAGDNRITIDKTLQEIYEAFCIGRAVYLDSPYGRIPCVSAQSNTATFSLAVSMGSGVVQLAGAYFANGQTGDFYVYNLTIE